MRKIKFAFVMLSLVLSSLGLYGQVTTSSLSGKVTDAKGESLPGAAVVAVHVPSGTQYATFTDNSGNFRIQNMRVGGPYKVDMSFVGYSASSYTEIVLKLGETYVQNGTLNETTRNLA